MQQAHKTEVMAVGHWVEAIDDDTPDLCTCDPAAIGQDGLTEAQICARAERIAACWNAFHGIPTAEIRNCEVIAP